MNSILTQFDNQVLGALTVTGIALAIGIVFAILLSFKMRGTKGFFITVLLMPTVVAAVISMLTVFMNNLTLEQTYMSRLLTIAVALGLVRFRSSNGRAEEMLVLFAAVAIGLVSGLGYVLFAAILALVVALVYLGIASTTLFSGKRFSNEKVLKITIPESLEYTEVFEQTFSHYLKFVELIEVKTTGMGSLFRLSYRIQMKNIKEEKEFIDELRTKNGNLEISILPYVGDDKVL